MFCENCGTQIADDSKVCEDCGYVIDPIGLKNQSESVMSPSKGTGISFVNKINKKVVGIVGGVIVAAVALIFIGQSVLTTFGDKGGPLLYFKNDGLYAMKANSEEPYLISEDASTEYTYGDHYGIYLSEDGSKLFFADNHDGNMFDLYLRNPKEEKPSGKDTDEKGIRVASKISSQGVDAFTVVDDGKGVLYYKDYEYGDGGKLYFNDLKEEIKIDSDVNFYRYEDGVVFYEKNDGDSRVLYSCELKADAKKTKIDSDIDSFDLVGKTIYYSIYDRADSTTALYVKEYGKDKKKIDEGVINYIYVTEDGTLYYSNVSEDGRTLYDFVSDEMLEQDKNIVEPDIKDYQTEVDSWYWSYYQTDYDSYYAARDLYYEKQSRDYLRGYLKSAIPFGDMCSIYRYDGDKPVLECKAASDINRVWGGTGTRGLSYIKKKIENLGPVADLADLTDESDIYNYLNDGVESDLCVLIDGRKESVIQSNTEIELYEMYLYGTTLACLDKKEHGLYTAKVNNGAVSELESLDYDVDSLRPDLNGDGFYYHKDADNDSADFYGYKDGKSKKLATDVHIGSVVFLGDSSEFMYLSDYDVDDHEGTAYLMKNGNKKTKLADDVYEVFSIKGKIYFLQDYKFGSGGDLCRFIKEGEREIIDEDVLSVVL